MKIYNKLVRDRIPEIIEKADKVAAYRHLDDLEFREALRAKVVEEAEELAAASEDTLPTELADLAEVFDAVLRAYNVTNEDLQALRAERNAERGCFEKRIFLESVSD